MPCSSEHLYMSVTRMLPTTTMMLSPRMVLMLAATCLADHDRMRVPVMMDQGGAVMRMRTEVLVE